MDDNGDTLQEIDAGANACSVEWCPVSGLESYMACATYLLGRETSNDDPGDAVATPGGAVNSPAADKMAGAGTGIGQMRTGSIVIHKLECKIPTLPVDSSGETNVPRLTAHLKEEASASLDGGVLDAKWCQQRLDDRGTGVIACATSTGRLVFYALREESGSDESEEKATKACPEFRQLASSDGGENMLLSLDWSGGRIADAKIVVSQSDGALAIWRPHPNGGDPVQELSPWNAHTLRGGVGTEAWISFFKKSSHPDEDEPILVVSGADDAFMKGWDLRTGGGAGGMSPAFVCKDHGAGVTAGQWHPTLQHVFASGSYDEGVRVWDTRSLRQPVSTISTGGGLWRLKWHPSPDRGSLLLAACMHAGVRVIDTGICVNDHLVQDSGWCLGGGRSKEIVARYTRHASMTYGADWCRLPGLLQSHRAVIASCSFYDSLLCLWQTPPLWS